MNRKNRVFLLTISGLIFGMGAVGVARIQRLDDWGAESTVMLPSDTGPITALIRKRHLVWNEPLGQLIDLDVKAVFVPSRKIYWFGFSHYWAGDGRTRLERRFLVFKNSIIAVTSDRGDVLRFYVSSATTVDNDPKREIDAICDQRLANIESKDIDVKFIPFGLETVLGYFPFTSVPDSQGEPAPSIGKIDANNDSFTIDLKGGDKGNVDATVTFDGTFKPLKATLKGKQVFPK